MLGRLADAESSCIKALDIRETVCVADDLRIAETLCVLCLVHAAKGELERAEEGAERCMYIRRARSSCEDVQSGVFDDRDDRDVMTPSGGAGSSGAGLAACILLKLIFFSPVCTSSRGGSTWQNRRQRHASTYGAKR